MLQNIIDLLNELGFKLTLNENMLAYGLFVFILFICVIGLITQWELIKKSIKEIVIQLFKEFKYTEETLGIFYDTIVDKVKNKLKNPDKNGKIPKINKWICLFLSLPLIKGIVIKQIKHYLDEIVKKCQEEGIDVHEVLNKDDEFEVPKIK